MRRHEAIQKEQAQYRPSTGLKGILGSESMIPPNMMAPSTPDPI